MVPDLLCLKILDQHLELRFPDALPSAATLRKQIQTRSGFQYEAVMCTLLKHVLGSLAAPVYMDVGGFIGFYSIFAARLLGARGRVIAVECNPDYRAVLRENVARNQVQVEILAEALSDRHEVLKYIGSALSAQPEAEGEAVPARPLDEICRQAGYVPQVMTMDVHGFEAKMLGGMQELLHGPLQYLLLELHPNIFLEEFTPGQTAFDILDLLAEVGFYSYYVAGHRYFFADGMPRFYEQGLAYLPLTRETRGLLLFDRYNQLFVCASKTPLEELVGPAVADPSQE